MEKIDFVNNSTPALNARNLNKLQDNIEDAIGESGGVTVRTVETTSDTETYSCNFTNGKFDKTSVKTSTTSSDTDTYSCNYINGKLDKTSVQTSKTSSSTDVYACDYINELTDVSYYEVTPVYTTLTPTYSLQKIGHLVFMNITSMYLASISTNTWANVATIPSALLPTTTITATCIMANYNTGNIEGHGRFELQTTGTLRVKVNTNSSAPMFTATLIWTV